MNVYEISYKESTDLSHPMIMIFHAEDREHAKEQLLDFYKDMIENPEVTHIALIA